MYNQYQLTHIINLFIVHLVHNLYYLAPLYVLIIGVL